MEGMIKEFKGEYRWLSNFAPVDIRFEGLVYPSVEHAYVSAKTDNQALKRLLTDEDLSAGDAKKLGKTVELPKHWEVDKLIIMRELLVKKFSQQPYMGKLIDTGDMYIQEGNYWNDTFWGIDLRIGEGQNHLGLMIMDIRDFLRLKIVEL